MRLLRTDGASETYNASGAVPYYVRPVDELAAFFDGLDVLEPGIVRITRWRPGPDGASGTAPDVDAYGGVGRKP